MKEKRLLFSITAKDFDMSTFSVSGNGGGGKDTSNSGVRLVHRASGAVGVGTEHRGNTRNRESAFNKLIKTDKFQKWLKIEAARKMGTPIRETPEEVRARVDRAVDEGLANGTIKVECVYE